MPLYHNRKLQKKGRFAIRLTENYRKKKRRIRKKKPTINIEKKEPVI